MKVKLTEAKLRQMIESVVREAFDDPELRKQIKAHGGLKKTKDLAYSDSGVLLRYSGTPITSNDARSIDTMPKDRDRHFDSHTADQNLKKAKFGSYISPKDANEFNQVMRKFTPRAQVDAEKSLGSHILGTNDGGVISLDYKGGDPDNWDKKLGRVSRLKGLPGKVRYSNLHLSDEDRENLTSADDIARDRRKNSYNYEPLPEKGARNNSRNRSGVTKVGAKNESRKSLKTIVAEQTRKALKNMIDGEGRKNR